MTLQFPNGNALAQVDLAIKTGIGISIQKDLSRIASENALKAELKEREHAYIPSSGDGEMRDEVDRLTMKSQELIKENQKLHTRLAERNALILEWMNSNEIFERLTVKFGRRLNVTKDEFSEQFRETTLDIAEEDPKFKDTKITNKARLTQKSLK